MSISFSLKLLSGVCTLSLPGVGIGGISTKDSVTGTSLDNEAFNPDKGNGSGTVSLTSSKEEKTLEASVSFTGSNGTANKTGKCSIKGSLESSIENVSTDGIKEQINSGLSKSTGIPEVDSSSTSGQKLNDVGKISSLRKFFENCIRNRNQEEKKAAEANGSNSATSTIYLNLKEESAGGNKYKFVDEQLKKVYEGIIYSVKSKDVQS